MTLLPLVDLIVQKPRPQTTLSLLPALHSHAREMVETYVFTDTIRDYFAKILDATATGSGQGFWVQAEYGAGKTHFLVVLAALLANDHADLWSLVTDEQIGLYRRRLQQSHLFPVVVSLRGMGEADTLTGRSLLDVLLEDGFEPALQRASLDDRVQVVAAEDYIVWLEEHTSVAIRNDVEAFVRHKTGRGSREYREGEGANALARLIAEYCQQNAIGPKIAASVKDRLAHIYRQITGLQPARYNGLLVMIDEYEGWEKAHPSPAARAHDEDVLETLAYLLPRDLGCQVVTVVASQSAIPAKLLGGQTGDRFVPIPLLASQNERDYDVIASRRVRGLREDRLPEISDHFLYCQQNFEFARGLSEAEFRDIFPFQPRCFEIVRKVTARDLPTARSGITIFHEVVSHPATLQRDMLVRAADLLHSPHLVDDCLPTPEYRDAYGAYKVAREALPTLELDAGDLPLAQAILDTLFLWHLAYKEHPRPMSLLDLAQATLTTSDFLRAEDNVAYVLGQMQSLRQVEFEGQQASFVPAGEEGASVVTLFNDYRRRMQDDAYRLSAIWSNSLFLSPQETRGQQALFSNFTPDEALTRRTEHRNLEYGGQMIVASRWQVDWGLPLPKDDSHFRLVILSSDAAQSLKAEDLQDPRIAVVYPAPLSDETARAAADWLAWNQMSDDYAESKRTGREAEAAREWLAGQRAALLQRLLDTQRRQYQSGRVITRDGLAISAREAFGQPGEDRLLAAIAAPLLAAAYPQLPLSWDQLARVLRPAEACRVFNGYFSRSPGTADSAATRNFGVALGLSHPEKPGHFSPQQARALDIIGEMLRERKGELPAWKVLETLSAPPYGLPYVLIQLYLLAFVRQGDPRAEIMLKRDHQIKTAARQPFSGNRITASSVVDLDFKPGLERYFDVLVEAAGPSWNDTVAYGREVLGELHATTDPADVEAQAQRLDVALVHLAEEQESTGRNLEILRQRLGAPLPDAARDALQGLGQLAGAGGSSYQRFYEQARELYATPDALRDQQRTFVRLKDLAGLSAEIIAARDYLSEIQLRPADQELALDRMAILGQIDLGNLASQPGQWSGIRAELDRFRARYRNTYHKHHRDFHAALGELQEALAEAPRRLRGLELLNGIEELGRPVGEDLARRYRALQGRAQPCAVPFAALTLEATPVCQQCRLTLVEEPPKADVAGFQRDLDKALLAQQRRLASEAIRRVLAKSQENAIATFVQVVQTANLASLLDLLDEDLVTFIQILLAEEEVATSESDLLQRFAAAYPTLEEADLPKALREFEALLRAAFDEARQANPDKKTVRLTLR
jgi:hypothetical protein